MSESTDIEVIDADVSNEVNKSENSEDRPIMLLFLKLISNDDTETTVLSNAQIIEILGKEFHIDVASIHKLEIDIYLNVMKKFLKEWPKWGQFDRVTHRLKGPKSKALLKRTLEDNYKLLKNYLKKKLMLTQPLAADAVRELQESLNNTKENESEKVIMEVFCSRDQLNQLFYRHPNGDLSTHVFNITNTVQNKIILIKWDIASVLNMQNVKVCINLNAFAYERETVHTLSHVLVNRKRERTTTLTKLHTRLQEKTLRGKQIEKQKILDTLNGILQMFKDDAKIYNILLNVFSVIEDDFLIAPDYLKVPARYRQYLSEYPYVRYLYANDNGPSSSDNNADKYDFQLQETVCPMFECFLGRADNLDNNLPLFEEWFNIECGLCKIKFTGNDLVEEMSEHFNDHHHNEPDWECTNCKAKFEIRHITQSRWRHECLKM